MSVVDDFASQLAGCLMCFVLILGASELRSANHFMFEMLAADLHVGCLEIQRRALPGEVC
jgi:hypothetical protein